MTLVEFAQEYKRLMFEDYGRTVNECPHSQFQRACHRFKAKFAFDLPEAYKTIMSVCNGIRFNGMTICPAVESPDFKETIEQFNEDLRDSFYDGFVYLGQRDEELYVWDVMRGVYCATEFAGRPIWREFPSAEAMFLFLLHRGLDMELED